jgi:hypothetical protein
VSQADNRFDVIIVGDFRVPGGTSRHVANEIQVLSTQGLSVGLAGVQLPHAKGRKPLDPLIRRQITLGNARLVSPTAARVSSSLALFENPRAFMERPLPAIRLHCNCALMIVHFPLRDGVGNKTFEPEHVTKICQGITDTQLEWIAVSPLIFRSLKQEAPSLDISSTILRSIVFAEEFYHPRRTWNCIPVIGRHSRPQPEKWPATRRDFLK